MPLVSGKIHKITQETLNLLKRFDWTADNIKTVYDCDGKAVGIVRNCEAIVIISFEDTIASRLTMGTWHEGMGFKTVKVLTADGKIGYMQLLPEQWEPDLD